MLHALPANSPDLHQLSTDCPCGPTLLRVNWRGKQRPAVYHREIAPGQGEPADECDTRLCG